MYGDENSKKIFTTKHAKPRDYTLPENIEHDLEGNILKFEVSETGKYLFAASEKAICIYNCDK